MKIKIKNRSIFFAVHNCFDSLSNKFTSQLYNLVSENSEDDYEQEIEVDTDTFVTIMNAVNSKPQGVAKDINPALYDSLKTQVAALAGQGNLEAIEIGQKMESILLANSQTLENQIAAGKELILS